MDPKKFLQNDRFAKLLGIELLEVGEGNATAQLEIKEEHLNTVDIAHGGAIFSLADYAFAAASNSHGNIAVGINANISFVKAAGKGILTAVATEISRTHRLATYNILVSNSEDELIASFQGMVYRKKETF
jgi:acyl-CoA thioesterase